MRLALGLGDIFEIRVVDTGLLEHRAGDGDIVVLGQRGHHAMRRVRHRRDPPREFRQRLDLDFLDQAADDVVEQRDVFIIEVRARRPKTGW